MVRTQIYEPSQSLGSRVLSLLFLVRSSGSQIYRKATGLKETELRLVSVIGRLGPLTHIQLVNTIGHGKPQVSRATRALIASGMLIHRSHRAAFELTDQGMALFEKLAGIADRRSADIVSGMSDDDLNFLKSVIAQQTALGERWLAEERNIPCAGKFDEDTNFVASSAGDASRDGLVSSIVTMAVIMQRAAFLRWRRTAGISPFDWVILSRVAEAGSIRMSDLVELTGRDKAQVSRTVSKLIEDSLLERVEQSNRREIELAATARGMKIYEITAVDSNRRDADAVAMLSQVDAARYRYLIERMIQNTQAMQSDDRINVT